MPIPTKYSISIPILDSSYNLINENKLFIGLNEKLKIKQCSVYIENAGDQLPCLSPCGALLPQLRNLMELTWLLKLR